MKGKVYLEKFLIYIYQGRSVKQKRIKNAKKDKLKNNFKLFRKNRINEYYSLVNLETSNPDFLRNSIADFSVNSCCFTDGCGFLNVS